jgi:DNA-directed RNA polymerase specialized sigma24 family protein
MITRGIVLGSNELGRSDRMAGVEAFTRFVQDAEPRLRVALVALYGTERGRDATAEALAFAWEHWTSIADLSNPAGYLFRVAQSRSRERRSPVVFTIPEDVEHDVEPGLPDALRALPSHQRLSVVLVHGYAWSVAEVAEFLGVKPTTVRNHLDRGLRRLRSSLGVDSNEH